MAIHVVTPLWQDRPAEENLQVAVNADNLGYPELWIGEMATYDAFALATAIGLKTKNIDITVGPLAVSVRTPMTIAMGVASVAALVDRPVRVAVGSSSTMVVEHWHGRKRERTARFLDESATILRGLLDGEKVEFEGEVLASRGYHLRLPTPKAHISVAAFGDAAVRAAARRGDRLLLNMVTVEAVAEFKAKLDVAAAALGKPAPEIAVWAGCAIDPSEQSMAQMLRSKVGYLSAPGYAEMFEQAGFSDLVTFARSRPHPKEVLAAIPPALAQAVGVIGDKAQVQARIDAYREAGADHICIVPATAGDAGGLQTLQDVAAMQF